MADAAVTRTVEHVSACMDDILTAFTPGGKITVLVRRPGEPTQDFMLTNDDIAEARAMLDRCEARGRTDG